MRNWKTSLFGLITAVAGFVAFSPQLFGAHPWVVQISAYIMAGGLGAIGFSAKDSTSHSTAAEVEKATVKKCGVEPGAGGVSITVTNEGEKK